MKGKNLLLLKEILEDLGYPDRSLFDDLCRGFKLTGWLPKSGVFPGRIRHPEYDVATLKLLSNRFEQIHLLSGAIHGERQNLNFHLGDDS